MLSRAKSIFTTIGGCASKPRVLEGGVKTEEPEEAIEKVAEEPDEKAATVAEEGQKKDVVITSGEADISGEEINKAEDHAAVVDNENAGAKSRSLGNLFMENEDEKESKKNEDSASSEVIPVEQVETTPNPEEKNVPAPVEDTKNAAMEEKKPEEVKLDAKEDEHVVTSEKQSEVKADLVAPKEESPEKKLPEEIVKSVLDERSLKALDEVKPATISVENVEKSEKVLEEEIKPNVDEGNAERSAKTSDKVKQTIAAEEVESFAKTAEDVKPGVEVKVVDKKVGDKIETPKEKNEETKPAIVKTEN